MYLIVPPAKGLAVFFSSVLILTSCFYSSQREYFFPVLFICILITLLSLNIALVTFSRDGLIIKRVSIYLVKNVEIRALHNGKYKFEYRFFNSVFGHLSIFCDSKRILYLPDMTRNSYSIIKTEFHKNNSFESAVFQEEEIEMKSD